MHPLYFPLLLVTIGCSAPSSLPSDDTGGSEENLTTYCEDPRGVLEFTDGVLTTFEAEAGGGVVAAGLTVASRSSSCIVRSYDFSLRCAFSDHDVDEEPALEEVVVEDNGEDVAPGAEFTRTLASTLSAELVELYDATCDIMIGGSSDDQVVIAEPPVVDTGAEIVSISHECSGETLTVRVETTGRLRASDGVTLYLIDNNVCEAGDGYAFEAGYHGDGDCWEELHSIRELDHADDNSSATYGADLSIADDFRDTEDGLTVLDCDYLARDDVNPGWVVHGTDYADGDAVCGADGDVSKVAETYACEP